MWNDAEQFSKTQEGVPNAVADMDNNWDETFIKISYLRDKGCNAQTLYLTVVLQVSFSKHWVWVRND